MSSIPFTLGNVAEIAVSPINADATTRAGGAGNRMVFAGVVIAPKGAPFEVLSVTESNWQAVLGTPEHTTKGGHTESLRQLAEAVKGGAGLVVRVTPDDFKAPAIVVQSAPEEVKKSKAGSIVSNSALPFGTEPTLTGDSQLAIWVTDGDPSLNRKISIEKADPAMYGDGMWELVLVSVDSADNETEIERHIVSMQLDAKDDMGRPAFIETVLESRSPRLTAKVGDAVAQFSGLVKSNFTGGTNGTPENIDVAAYQRAIAILSATVLPFTAVCGLGVYDDAVIRELATLANSRRVGAFIDINPRLTYAEALEKATDLALNQERVSLYHFPYTYKDAFFGNRTMAGLSGIAFTAKAKGVAKTFPNGGWHYTAAGEERAIISRSGLKLVAGVGTPDYEAMYKARINKVASNAAGLMFIDDSLTSYTRENYLRFEQVVSVADAISRDFATLANQLKHNPDGVTFTGLVDGMTDILDGYVANGALVPPRDPEDGKEPYQLFVEQIEIDAWRCRWAICVSGSGRRFLGEPVLVR